MERRITMPLSERVRIESRQDRVSKSSAYPLGLYWSVSGHVLREEWVEVIRIDNAAHRGIGAHVHFLDQIRKGNNPVIRVDMKHPTEAWDFVEEYLMKKYKDLIENDS